MTAGTRNTAVLPLAAAAMATIVFLTAPAEAGEPELITALTALQNHVNGTVTLSASQIATHKLTIDANRTIFGDSAETIQASFNLVDTYDRIIKPLWSLGSPTANGFSRSAVSNGDINWAMFNVMQDIMDDTYTASNLQTYPGLLGAFKFGSADVFPGHVAPPVDPSATYTVAIDGSFLKSWGRDTMHWSDADHPARQATGAYLAPGTIATVTVPPSLVGQGYQIRVEGHSWDFSNKDPIDRLDRSSLLYDINSTQVQVASPLGGSIYVEVPYLANAGVVNVQFQNVVQAPLFSMQSFHTTTPAEWQAMVNSSNRAPWADFQTDKFMMNVPTGWIYNMSNPTALMQNWDKAMDIINDLMGFPRIRGKESMFPQVDVRIRASAYAPGYPAVNDTYNPDTNYGGTSSNNLVTGPQYAAYYEFHELGHQYLFPKFPGETEAEVNLLHVAVWNQGFGYDLNKALRGSMGVTNTFQTTDTTAVEWMASFNFVEKQPMDQLEKQYQLKGHAKFVEIARLFGWGVLGDYWKSFNTDYENGVSYSTEIDSLLLRLSKSVGKDITPLFHFYGVHPQNLTTLQAALRAANVHASQEMYDLLEDYETLIPANNAAFRQYCLSWWGHQPSVDGYWTESEHAKQWDDTYGVMYDEDTAAAIRAVIDDLIGQYFPTPYIGYELGDLNRDNALDGLDWQCFIAGNQADLSGLTWREAYVLGDLDGDGDNDIYDFAKFREAYELYHPEPGAFAAMLASSSTPEPSTILLLAAGAATVAMWRRRRARR